MKLWFENSWGNERVIAENCNSWVAVNKEIDKFIDNCNKDKPTDQQFHRYYTRCWQIPDGRMKFDVGSHTEFFIWDGTLDDYHSFANNSNN